jgi:DNA mismatch repair protein MutS
MDWYAAHEGMLRDTVEFAATLDVATTAARMALTHKYCRPEIVHDGAKSWFDTKGLRHMLAERIDDDELFVPNDLAFGGDQSPKGMLLFGTNASGKSTLIKSVGIAVTLTQAGFYVPATTFRLRPYSAIYTRILGNDDLFRGLSTFAVEMTEFNAILNNANVRTLVLGDELCSGTETVSAVSIFASGLVSLADTGCTHLFATHFHEVVKIPCVQELEHLVSKHLEVRYDAEADTLVYDRKLADGSGDSIYGLEVCKSLKMPQAFIDRAYSVRQVLVPKSGSVLGSKISRYSSKKVRGGCELCGAAGAHIHHLMHQADADNERMVDHFRVDAAANLINVCEACHNKFHVDGTDAVRHRRAKAIDGRSVIVPI